MKYGNKKLCYQSKIFDSKRELSRYLELKILERAGAITDLKRQVPYTLISAQYINKKCVERPVKYYADFVYCENGKTVVEDVKSPATRTKDYVIKRKLMLMRYGIKIKEIYE